ncbi:hypothetical protein CEXT_796111 [Caerostris extrusa]|uniref:Uncharacterized protein n=1 Tax=Caerostris extrusa TaxID=172846 RepID=A0AAV4YFT6_CAEEX|nr:hypothetical protein CEXT_796111 [Caerostris extrusa]
MISPLQRSCPLTTSKKECSTPILDKLARPAITRHLGRLMGIAALDEELSGQKWDDVPIHILIDCSGCSLARDVLFLSGCYLVPSQQ